MPYSGGQGVLVTLVLVLGRVCSMSQLHQHNDNVDPVSRQLYDYRDHTPVPGILTTSAGRPVEVFELSTLNGNLLSNVPVLESIMHAVNERRPDREVFPKATGARGYFVVNNDVSQYTKAKVFECVGKRTPVLTRLAESQIDKGGSDANPAAARGMSVKFYTEDGNFDLLGIHIPVYFYRDPTLFRDMLHALRPNPQTNIRDFTSGVDLIINNPIMLPTLLWSLSEYGNPRGYRHMNAFPIHTYPLYNAQGETHYARFRFIADLGFDFFTQEEAQVIGSFDPDFYIRDLYNSIENGNYPSWTLEMDVLSSSDLCEINFDPFDVTRLWPNGTYCTVQIGQLVLNENIQNAFAEIEDAAFYPGNLVPGISPPPDQIFKGRIIAYLLAQVGRLGINYNKIPVNCPLYSNTYHRDGVPPVLSNGGDQVPYLTRSFNGPQPLVDETRPPVLESVFEENILDLEGCRRFYNEVLSADDQKERLIKGLVRSTLRVHHEMIQKLIDLIRQVDEKFSQRYSDAIYLAKKYIKLPNVVTDLDPDHLNPYDVEITF